MTLYVGTYQPGHELKRYESRFSDFYENGNTRHKLCDLLYLLSPQILLVEPCDRLICKQNTLERRYFDVGVASEFGLALGLCIMTACRSNFEPTQQTHDVESMLFHLWSTVYDAGPTLNQQ